MKRSAAAVLCVAWARLFAAASSGRVAVILHGETFRAHSTQHSREVGIHAFTPQKEAVKSQVEHIFHPLKHHMGYEVEVFLETYNTTWLPSLVEWYGSWLAPSGVHMLDPTKGEGQRLTELGFAPAILNGTRYDALLVLRPDLVPRPLFGCSLVHAA